MKFRKVMSYIQISGLTATTRKDNRTFFIGAVGLRSDGALVKSLNGPSFQRTQEAHAEARLIRKLDRGATVFVARVAAGTGEFAMAKPCADCIRRLRGANVKRVYYTINASEYGIIDL